MTDAEMTVPPFDHDDVARLPEYTAAAMALDTLAHALRDTGWDGSRERWLDMVGQMASGLPITDSCRVGLHSVGDDHRAPFRVEREGDRLLAWYWCSEHEQVWSCGWGADISWMGGFN